MSAMHNACRACYVRFLTYVPRWAAQRWELDQRKAKEQLVGSQEEVETDWQAAK